LKIEYTLICRIKLTISNERKETNKPYEGVQTFQVEKQINNKDGIIPERLLVNNILCAD
jgi:hypothetical protein